MSWCKQSPYSYSPTLLQDGVPPHGYTVDKELEQKVNNITCSSKLPVHQ